MYCKLLKQHPSTLHGMLHVHAGIFYDKYDIGKTLTASGTFNAVSGLPPYAVSTSLVAIGAALAISTSLSEANLDILEWRLLSL